MPSKIPSIKGTKTSRKPRKRRKPIARSRNPFYDEKGRPTQKLQHLVWCANFEEIFEDRDPLRQAFERWINEWDAEMHEKLAKVVRDCRRGFENLTIKDRATVYAIRAIKELYADPRFDSEKPSIPMLKARTLELMVRDAPLLPGETAAEQKKRLESKVRWPNLFANLRPSGFVRTLGRPMKASNKTGGDTIPTIFSWDMREFKSPPESPLALGLMNQVPPGGG
jgi:hypothetical protein